MPLYKPKFKRTRPDGTAEEYQSPNWSYTFKHPLTGRRVKGATGTRDKSAATLAYADAVNRAKREADEKQHPHRKHAKRPLTEHLDAFEQHLRRPKRDNAESHIANTVPRVRKVLDGCGFTYHADIDPDRVEDFIDDLIGGGLSQQTAAYYQRCAKAFTRWLRVYGRAMTDPLERLESIGVTDHDDYRALTDDEVDALIEAARAPTVLVTVERRRNGKLVTEAVIRDPNVVQSVPGDEWAVVFAVAVDTGLRFNELRTLTWARVHIDGDDPHVIVRAAYSKNREEAKQPMLVDGAAELRAWRDAAGQVDSDAPVFPSLGKWTKPAIAIEAYREAAGVPYRTDDGRCVFHSFRHTYITNLDRAGVHPTVRQQLGRHKTARMSERYTHAAPRLLTDASKSIPSRQARRRKARGVA